MSQSSEDESEHEYDEPSNKRLKATQENTDSESEQNEEDGEDAELDRYWPLPMEETVSSTISYLGKTVSALAINNSGTRYAVGSHDYELKLFDFERHVGTRSVQPCGQTVINNIDYAPNDEMILVVAGNCQATVVGKDGQVIHQCAKGDQYIRDMTHTKGHVQMINDGCFHRKDRNIFVTSSNDGTLRLWNLNNKLTQQETVIKVRSPMSGLKAQPNICRFSRDSLTLATGCNDGSLMLWDTRRKYVTTSAVVKNAHLKGSEIIGIDFSYNLTKMCSRSEDDFCKLWDLRKLKDPLASQGGLSSIYTNADCVFSPDDKLILLGTSGSNKTDPGDLQVLDADSLAKKATIKVEDGAVVRCRWHPKINHIAYTTSNGNLFIAFDKKRSVGGLVNTISTRVQSNTKKSKR